MTEPDHGGIRDAQVTPVLDSIAAIAALREAGADRFDPVRLHFIEVLARRTAVQQGLSRSILEARLVAAVAAFGERLEQAQHVVGAADDSNGGSGCVTAREHGAPRTSLGELARYIEQHSPQTGDAGLAANAGPRAELKAIRYFRNTWSKLSVEQQVAQAIDQAPENAGPLNSHFLVLQSLTTMREIAPDYLNRFMSYVDTLLCLDQADKKGRPAAKKPPRAKATKA